MNPFVKPYKDTVARLEQIQAKQNLLAAQHELYNRLISGGVDPKIAEDAARTADYNSFEGGKAPMHHGNVVASYFKKIRECKEALGEYPQVLNYMVVADADKSGKTWKVISDCYDNYEDALNFRGDNVVQRSYRFPRIVANIV